MAAKVQIPLSLSCGFPPMLSVPSSTTYHSPVISMSLFLSLSLNLLGHWLVPVCWLSSPLLFSSLSGSPLATLLSLLSLQLASAIP